MRLNYSFDDKKKKELFRIVGETFGKRWVCIGLFFGGVFFIAMGVGNDEGNIFRRAIDLIIGFLAASSSILMFIRIVKMRSHVRSAIRAGASLEWDLTDQGLSFLQGASHIRWKSLRKVCMTKIGMIFFSDKTQIWIPAEVVDTPNVADKINVLLDADKIKVVRKRVGPI